MDVAEETCAEAAASGNGPPVFEIGLIAAGAVSAGAYTAGVLDFLVEAMDSFEAAQAGSDPNVPTHRVAVRAMVGASAGAMNAAILAAWAQRDFPHPSYGDIENALIRNANPFAWAWIDQPDVTRLLATDDLQEGKVPSLLNGAWLRDVMRQILSPGSASKDQAPDPSQFMPPAQGKQRKWLEDLRVRITVGNLTGTPFELRFGKNLTGNTGPLAGGMTDHGEVLDFIAVPREVKADPADACTPRKRYLTLPSDVSAFCADWDHLGSAAIASGAFPIALPAQTLSRPQEQRPKRWVFVPNGDVSNPDAGKWERLHPNWPDPPDPNMCCVDGGIINNEPIELCREALLLHHGGRLERDPALAKHSMIMIDPFPDPPASSKINPGAGLLALAGALVGAWKSQARYRPVDLMLAARDGSFSRQLIEPSVDGKGRPAGAPALAGASLGGFFGFFHKDFRTHDYLLGRHNCRSFLQRHFVVPLCNPVVAHWALDPTTGSATELAKHVMTSHGLCHAAGKVPLVWLKVELRDPKPCKPATDKTPAEKASCDKAVGDKVRQPHWPKGCFEPALLRPALTARTKAVLRTLSREAGFFWRNGIKLASGAVAGWLAGKAVTALITVRDRSKLSGDSQ